MIARDSFYFDYEPFVAERMSASDIRTLDGIESEWLEQAAAYMQPAEYAAAEAQWVQWKAQSPEYRLIAYYDGFGGNQEDIPMVLQNAIGWRPDDGDAQLAPMFAAVADALAHGSSAPSGGSGAGSGSKSVAGLNGLGVVLLAGAAFFLMSRGRR